MFDFGDELTVESYRVPWLIWIQALVMFLLIILFYCFSIFDLSDTDNHTSSTASPSSSSRRVSNDAHPLSKLNTTTRFVSNRLQTTQVGESQSIKGEISAGTSRRVVRGGGGGGGGGGEDNVDRESSSGAHIRFHPCYYFNLAKLAVLKCLGLDPASENSSTPQRRKSKEQ
ncbi:uncharacterized protein LOC107425489 [Ziziphus jujuba]|uniref:Uncharacterized protein LOC107425489 n=1 Tax=Ziziphus jujuba TaxID=326968 RepID=A0A6P4A629_ZIZJJ|nr:uncharacterized protein LOC107425489 [Ziziphus jujuba]